jgi:hypothetical protein
MNIKRIGSIAARVVAVSALLFPGVYGSTLTDEQQISQTNNLTYQQKNQHTKKLIVAIFKHATMLTDVIAASVEEKEQAWQVVVNIINEHKTWSIMTYDVWYMPYTYNDPDSVRTTPVEFAFKESCFDAFKYMIRSGVDPDFISKHTRAQQPTTFAYKTVLHHVNRDMSSDEKWFKFLVVEKFKISKLN